MKRRLALLFLLLTPLSSFADRYYPWIPDNQIIETISERFPPPAGFERTAEAPGSFGDWLRHLPLKPPGEPVRYFNGKIKANANIYSAVVDIDTGGEDLQQCADAVIRLRAEYLWSRAAYDAIRFNFTSGDPAPYLRWRQGLRPQVNGNHVRWTRLAEWDGSHESFRRYLDSVFMYAGSWSLNRELPPKRDLEALAIGDVFIKGGFPGHAAIVVDMAVDPVSGEKVFLLAQSYMPAQDIQILQNPASPDHGSWYSLPRGGRLVTPEWTFQAAELKTFDEPESYPVFSLRKRDTRVPRAYPPAPSDSGAAHSGWKSASPS